MVSLVIEILQRLKKYGMKYVKDLFENRPRWKKASKLHEQITSDSTILETPIDQLCKNDSNDAVETGDEQPTTMDKSKKEAFRDAFEEFFFEESLFNYKMNREKSQALVESFMKKDEDKLKKERIPSSDRDKKPKKMIQQPWIHVDEWRLTNDTKAAVVSDSEDSDSEDISSRLGIDGPDSPWELNMEEKKVVLKKLPNAVRVPFALFEKLYPHQRSGLEWMAGLRLDGRGGILGDEMGLGKTMQALTFLLCLMSTKTIRNAMIICPVPIVNATWKAEVDKLLKYFPGKSPPIEVCVVAGSMKCPKQRNKVLKKAKYCTRDNPHLVITTYSMFTKKELPSGLKNYKKNFEYVFLDEGHKAKNKHSNTSKNITKILTNNTHVIVLSGTPLLNRLEELYRLLRMCTGEELVGKENVFKVKYIKPIEAARQRTASDYTLTTGERVLKELKEKIQPYILKRQRKDHLKNEVPPNHQFDIWLKLSPKQRQLYQGYLTSDNKNVQGVSRGDVKCVLPVIGELRTLCGHPLLHKKNRREVSPSAQSEEEGDIDQLEEEHTYNEKSVLDKCASLGVDEVVSQSPKVQFLKDTTEKWADQGHRTLIFAHHRGTLDILEFVFANSEGINACRIDGATSAKKLAFLVKHFNSDESMFNVLLMSTKVGSEGLTLTGASKCVVFEPVWTQAESDQAVARICRPGQRFECESLFLIAAGTVEEKMVGKQIYKGCLDRTVLGDASRGSNGNGSYSRLYNKKELSHLFELAPEGTCETIDRLKESGNYNSDKGLEKCSVDKKHRSVVGISQRSELYNKKGKAEGRVDDENATSNKKARLSPDDVTAMPVVVETVSDDESMEEEEDVAVTPSFRFPYATPSPAGVTGFVTENAIVVWEPKKAYF